MATEEKISNSGATVEVTENLQESTGAEILDDNIQATPSAEQVVPVIPPEVQKAGITAILPPHHEMLSGSEVPIGDGSSVTLPLEKQKIVTELFESRAHIPGPVGNTSTWHRFTQTKNKILGLFRNLPKAA